MYRKTKNDWQKHIDFIVMDAVMLILSIWIATTIRNDPTAIWTYRIYREMCITVLLADLAYAALAKPYSGIIYRTTLEEVRTVFWHVASITLTFLVYCFVMQSSEAVSRMATLFFALYAFMLLLTERELLKYVLKQRRPVPDSREALIAANYGDASDLIGRLSELPRTAFLPVGIILLGAKVSKDSIGGIPIIARDIDAATKYIEDHVVDEIIFIDPEEESFYDELLSACETMGLTTHIILKKSGNLGSTTMESIAGMNAVSSCMKLVSSTDLLVKRFVDILGGIVGLLFTGLLFAVVAPAIYISDPGPIFFKQTRIGRNGRKFEIYKFRSMYQDAEARKKDLMDRNEMQGQIFKIENDPRIIGSGPDGTKKGIGWFIRAFSIDEFPQFLNVLKGDMSLVGTRPPTLDEWEQYEKHHRKRMRVKPGITGLWQISGRSDILDFEEIVDLDTQYIRNWSFWLDIQIILKTAVVVITRKGSK